MEEYDRKHHMEQIDPKNVNPNLVGYKKCIYCHRYYDEKIEHKCVDVTLNADRRALYGR